MSIFLSLRWAIAVHSLRTLVYLVKFPWALLTCLQFSIGCCLLLARCNQIFLSAFPLCPKSLTSCWPSVCKDLPSQVCLFVCFPPESYFLTSAFDVLLFCTQWRSLRTAVASEFLWLGFLKFLIGQGSPGVAIKNLLKVTLVTLYPDLYSWLPKHLTTDSPLLTGNLTHNMNSWFSSILYVICIIYSFLTIK